MAFYYQLQQSSLDFFCDVRAEEWLPSEFTTNSSCDNFLKEFCSLIELGNLPLARRKALEAIHNSASNRRSKRFISNVYITSFQRCFNATGNDYLHKIQQSLHTENASSLRAKKDSPNCIEMHINWSGIDPNEVWDEFCSIFPVGKGRNPKTLPSLGKKSKFESSSQTPCCEFAPGSWTYLRLPVIHEPAIRLRIPHRKNNDTQEKQSKTLDSIYTYLDLE